MTIFAPEVPSAGLLNRCTAALYDPLIAIGERRTMAVLRHDLLIAATGRVLEIGAGTGRNVTSYPPTLTELVLTEPNPGMLRHLRKRVHRTNCAATVLCTGAESLPFPANTFDTVVSTLVLCTVPDPAAAIHEALRVLRPGGQLLFIEHVRADNPRLARRQDRWLRPWRRFASGCHCNRSTAALLAQHFGAQLTYRSLIWHGMPGIVGPLIVGHAVKDA